MGGGPSMPAAQPVPPPPAPIDYDKMYAAATRGAIAQMREQEAAIERLYPKMTALQMQTARQIAGELDNQYLQRTRGVIGEELQAASAPNAIEAQLQRDAEAELALGRSLSPEQERAATQSARAAMAARGMATGNAAVGAEILNRDAFAQQRLDQRRQFALGANQLDLARRQRRLGLAIGYGDLDPYARALNPAFQVGSATMGQGTQLIGNTFNNALQQSGNVETFNVNMAASNRNAILNNNAAMQAAAMQSGAMGQSGMLGMAGGIGGGLLMGAGLAI